jgi:purine nucleosidase
MKLWLDCDPGFDDWMAILLLDTLGQESTSISQQSNQPTDPYEWIGCSIVAGNAPIEHVWRNACSIWKHYDLVVPLFKSAHVTSAQMSAQHVLGISGMKTTGHALPLAASDAAKLHLGKPALDACEALQQALVHIKTKLTIVCIGPLTHIATVLAQAPHLSSKVEQIILMGGSTDRGNQTPAAEFNIAADPQSADVVFRSGIPIVMLGLNVCRQMQVTQQHVQQFTGLSAQRAQWFGGYFDAYQKIRSSDGSIPMPLYDPIVVAYLKNPAWFQMQSARVDIELQGEFTKGMTVVDFKTAFLPPNRPANALVALQVDGQGALDWIMQTLVQRFLSQG